VGWDCLNSTSRYSTDKKSKVINLAL